MLITEFIPGFRAVILRLSFVSGTSKVFRIVSKAVEINIRIKITSSDAFRQLQTKQVRIGCQENGGSWGVKRALPLQLDYRFHVAATTKVGGTKPSSSY